MVITKLELTNFGQFHNKEIRLEKGLNIIYGENETGKSTIHTFIRGMIFGIEKQRGRAAANDTYQRYQPWENSSYYEGVMEVEAEGRYYRITRNFNKDNKSLSVIDLENGFELTREEREELLEGIDEACYYNTISIGQLGAKTDESLNLILKNYAANLSSTRDAQMNMVAATDALKDSRKKEKAKIKNESRQDLMNQQTRLENDFQAAEQEKLQISRKQEELDAQQKKQEEEYAKLQEEEVAWRENQTRRKTVVDELKKQLEKTGAVTSRIKKTLSQDLESLEPMKQEMQQYNIKSMEEVEEQIQEESLSSIVSLPCLILMMLEIIGVALSVVLLKNDLITLAVLGALLITLIVFFILVGIRKGEKKKRLNEWNSLKKVVSDAAEIREKIKEDQNKLEEAKEEIESLKENIREQSEMISEKMDDHGQKEKIQLAIDKIQDQKKALYWQMERAKEKEKQICATREEIKEKIIKIDQATKEIEAIDLAVLNIEEAAKEIRESFGKELNRKTSQYLTKITDGKYKQVFLDDNLQIQVTDGNQLVPRDNLSKGTIEQVYLALRLAAVSVMFQQGKPILLDDAFVQYDNKRMRATLRFLAEEFEQVIVFSCHTREKVMADKIEIPYHLIVLGK